MSIDAEAIADRRRLRRKLSFWRVAGFLGLIAAVAAIGYAVADRAGYGAIQNQIARISIDGVITGNQRLADLMQRVGDSSAVSGVVISINSPGGTTTGSEELFRNIRRLSEKKPLVAFVDGTAAPWVPIISWPGRPPLWARSVFWSNIPTCRVCSRTWA
jgi:protease-4